jgi:hypothetical protein
MLGIFFAEYEKKIADLKQVGEMESKQPLLYLLLMKK